MVQDMKPAKVSGKVTLAQLRTEAQRVHGMCNITESKKLTGEWGLCIEKTRNRRVTYTGRSRMASRRHAMESLRALTVYGWDEPERLDLEGKS